ncbi:MAG: amidase [Actinomycetota bacterium]
MTDLAALDATAQADLVRRGEASPLELVDAAIARIEAVNGDLNAVIHPLYDRARAAAAAAPAGPFTGVPIVLKDLDGTLAHAPMHSGNRALKAVGNVATVTSHLFRRLEAAGFVVVGKTNTPEFGLMPTTEPLAYGPSRNPWNPEHSPGGSSGGSAAAVASGMVPVGHAGDGGGSIRIPASMCGLFGLKPSRGRISLGPRESEAWAGLVARHVVTRTVRDSAAILDVLAGYETGDWYTAPPAVRPYADVVGADPGRLRIGVRTAAPFGAATVDPECVAAVEGAARLLESLGHSVEEAAPAGIDDIGLVAAFGAVMQTAVRAEVAALAAQLGRPVTADDVEPMTWMLHEQGAGIDAAGYVATVADMQRSIRTLVDWWTDDGFDLLLTPTCAEPPPRIGDVGNQSDGGINSSARSLPFAIFTAPFNVSGQPAMSVPLHTSAAGLPVGVQLVAAPYREDLCLRVAAQLEAAQPWADRRPAVHA